MTSFDKLIERLQNVFGRNTTICYKAADALKTLQARVKQLESGYEELAGWGEKQCTMRHVSTFAKKVLSLEPPSSNL